MGLLVVDASVAAKWFAEGEEHAGAALSVLRGDDELHVPDFFFLEMDSVVCKWVRRSVISLPEAAEIRTALRRIPFGIHPLGDLREAAYAIAIETGRTPYDCLYVALAALLGARTVTADRRLFEALVGGPFAGQLAWVDEFA